MGLLTSEGSLDSVRIPCVNQGHLPLIFDDNYGERQFTLPGRASTCYQTV